MLQEWQATDNIVSDLTGRRFHLRSPTAKTNALLLDQLDLFQTIYNEIEKPCKVQKSDDVNISISAATWSHIAHKVGQAVIRVQSTWVQRLPTFS